MQNIEVKEITSKSGTNKNGNWKQFTILTKDGAKFSSFDTKFEEIKPGSVLAVEPEIKGRYTNIKEWKLISEPTPTKLNELFSSPLYHVSSLMKIACLQEVGHYIRKADMRDDAQRSSLIPKGANALYQAIVDKYWQIIDQNLDSLLGETKTTVPETKAPPGETKPAADEIPAFKAGYELVNYATKHGKTFDEIKEVLGIKNPIEITDVKAATEKLYPNSHLIK